MRHQLLRRQETINLFVQVQPPWQEIQQLVEQGHGQQYQGQEVQLRQAVQLQE